MRSTLLALFLGLAACDGGPTSPGPPLPVTVEGIDAEVLELIEERAQAVRDQPGESSSWELLGLAYEAHHMFELALPCYEQAVLLASSGADPRLRYRLAIGRAHGGRFEGAVEAGREVVRSAPDYGPAHCRLASWYWELGELEAAESAYRAALELDDSDPAALLGLAQILLAGGRPAEALGLVDGMLQVPPPARAVFHQLRGTALARLGRSDEARGELALGRGADQYLPDPWTRELSEHKRGMAARYFRAQRMVDRGRLAAALELLQEAQAVRSDFLPVVRLLSSTLFELQRVGEAMQLLEETTAAGAALEREESLHMALARMRLLSGRLEEALDSARRARELAPASAEAVELELEVLLAQGRFGEVLEVRDAAASPELLEPAAQVLVGKALLELQRAGEALVLFEQLAGEGTGPVPEEAPGTGIRIEALAGKALALLALQRLQDARGALGDLESRAPDHPLLPALREALARADGDG